MDSLGACHQGLGEVGRPYPAALENPEPQLQMGKVRLRGGGGGSKQKKVTNSGRSQKRKTRLFLLESGLGTG